ncbi:MAG: hypothetical protein K6F63_07300 [Lachnospiraceae bacterium]|nr:hypothetical protein [Lachnospiraceae bacterium]
MENNNSQMTKGQERRLAKKKEAAKAKRAARTSSILGVTIAILLIAAIVFGIVYGIYNNLKTKKAEAERLARLIPVVEDYSKGLNDDGTIAGLDPDDYITLGFNPADAITIPYSEIEYTEEQVEDAINTLLMNNSDENGQLPEFNDAFVKDVLKEDMTAEEYKAKIKSDNEQANKEEWIVDYVANNYDAQDKPEEYAYTYAGVLKAIDEKQLEYSNQLYVAYTGSIIYDDVYDMREMTEDEYEEYVLNEATKGAIMMLVYQKLYSEMGVTYTQEEYKDYLADNGVSNIYDFGEGYIMMNFKEELVRKALTEKAVVDKNS